MDRTAAPGKGFRYWDALLPAEFPQDEGDGLFWHDAVLIVCGHDHIIIRSLKDVEVVFHRVYATAVADVGKEAFIVHSSILVQTPDCLTLGGRRSGVKLTLKIRKAETISFLGGKGAKRESQRSGKAGVQSTTGHF